MQDRILRLVAQDCILLYRGFSIRKPFVNPPAPQFPLPAECNSAIQQIGKSALRRILSCAPRTEVSACLGPALCTHPFSQRAHPPPSVTHNSILSVSARNIAGFEESGVRWQSEAATPLSIERPEKPKRRGASLPAALQEPRLRLGCVDLYRRFPIFPIGRASTVPDASRVTHAQRTASPRYAYRPFRPHPLVTENACRVQSGTSPAHLRCWESEVPPEPLLFPRVPRRSMDGWATARAISIQDSRSVEDLSAGRGIRIGEGHDAGQVRDHLERTPNHVSARFFDHVSRTSGAGQ